MTHNRKSSGGSRRGHFDVGYGRPPKSGRFKPGQSGNPKGRKRGTKNFGRMLEEALEQRIRVREGDKIRTMTKKEAIILTLLTKAMQADAKVCSLLMAQLRERGQLAPEPINHNIEVMFVKPKNTDD